MLGKKERTAGLSREASALQQYRQAKKSAAWVPKEDCSGAGALPTKEEVGSVRNVPRGGQKKVKRMVLPAHKGSRCGEKIGGLDPEVQKGGRVGSKIHLGKGKERLSLYFSCAS